MSDSLTGGTFSPWLLLLRDLSVKSALLLLAAWALTLGMRRASAAARHLVWLLAFAGLLLLPLLSVTLPARPVLILPAPSTPVLPRPAAPIALSFPTTPSIAIEAPTLAVPDQHPAPPPPVRSLPAPTPPPARLDWPLLLCPFWLDGVVLAVFPLLAGWLLAVRRIRRCSPVTDPTTLALAAEAGHQFGLRRSVSLRSGPSVSVPVTFGLLRPVILLPDGAASWPAERLHVALLHELAHIRRGDWAVQTLARLVCALLWHNPLVWPAARMLRAEAERACDDLVLSVGVPAPDYAQHLLAVAAALSGASRPLPLAVPMAGCGLLEARLRAVLTSRPRRAPSRRLAALAFLLALVVLVPLAVLRPAARAARRIAPPLMLAPVLLPVPPEAIRPSHPPIGAAVIPPAPFPLLVPTKSTPLGVPPMKPLTPVKVAALAALAAGLTLPAAHAQPTAPVKHAPTPKRAYAPPPTQVQMLLAQARQGNINAHTGLINLATQGDVTNGVGMLFEGSHRSYVIEPGVSGIVKVKLNDLPFDSALTNLLESSSQPLEWSIQRGVYHIRPRAISSAVVAQEPRLPSYPVTLDLKKVPIRQALDSLFGPAGANYTVAAGVPDDKDLVTVHLTNVPFVLALNAVLAASDPPLAYTVGRGGIIAVAPAHTYINLFGGPSRSLFRITRNDRATEQGVAALLTERAAKLSEGLAPRHPDIVALDARIAELQRRQRAEESGVMKLMKPKPVNPALNNAP